MGEYTCSNIFLGVEIENCISALELYDINL